jgi:hypothetical protein
MLTPVKRSEVFRSSRFNDRLIASFQASYGRDFDASVPKEKAALAKYYDHMEPFDAEGTAEEAYSVVAYKTYNRQEYLTIFPQQLKQALHLLDIHHLYLLDFTNVNLLKEFAFENFHKRNLFKRLGAVKAENVAYRFNTAAIDKVMPLFFFSGVYDVPVIFFLSADDIPLGFHLCDDGNLHLNYEAKDENRILAAMKQAGFATGDTGLCSLYSTYYHRLGGPPGYAEMNEE